MDPVTLRCDRLGKCFSVPETKGSVRYQTLQDSILGLPRKLAGILGPKRNSSDFWALRHLSFEARPGEVIGIIGRNGAGKSTLLKILSRITNPTEGRAELFGRVGSLLEVGTGFHPELTGRENIFLSGALLGMRKTEIASRFDDIVSFAEVGRFIDMPCKHYSSGMYTRLGFSVAAFLRADILLVDEVLAVGDASFQERCAGKMSDVSKDGRTILFVSHNLSAVRALCTRAIVLEAGRGHDWDGDVAGALASYLGTGQGAATWTPLPGWVAPGREFFSPSLLSVEAPPSGEVDPDLPIKVSIQGEVAQPHPQLCIGLALYGPEDQPLLWSYHNEGLPESPKLEPGPVSLTCELPGGLLNAGEYRVELISGIHAQEWHHEPRRGGPSVHFSIRHPPHARGFRVVKRPTCLSPLLEWKVGKYPPAAHRS